MTSGEFHAVRVADIIVDRQGRQRRELKNIDILANSIGRLGLIHPLVLTRELVLVSGERRFEAVQSLGWTHVNCQWVDELSPDHLHAIELEENVKREDIDWKDKAAAIKKYHEFRLSTDPKWSEAATAKAIGFEQPYISKNLALAQDLEKGTKEIVEAPKFSTAYGIIERRNERKSAAIEEALREVESPEIPRTEESILQADFLTWEYSGPRFNLIHCDFPYGIGADKFNQGSAPSHGGYVDTEEYYWRLVHNLLDRTERLVADSAHLVFWFSLDYYQPTLDALSREWTILPHPLIWFKSDNVGILPDPQRGPRRVYETAFFGYRGDRRVVRAVSNLYAAPSVRDTHMSEKSEAMLRYFFGMVIDEHSIVLDPTCGSGSAIRAAESLGAKSVVGLEVSEEFASRARLKLSQARTLRESANV